MPELDLTFDLPEFGRPLEMTDGSSLMSPISMASKQSGNQRLAQKEIEGVEGAEEGEPAPALSLSALLLVLGCRIQSLDLPLA